MDEQQTWLESEQELLELKKHSQDAQEQEAVQFLIDLRKSEQSFASNPNQIYSSKKYLPSHNLTKTENVFVH